MKNQKKWEDEYKNGRGKKYPDGELIWRIFRLFGRYTSKKNIKILDLGSGAGGNLWFFAREGFETYGIDFSETACKKAKKFLNEEGLYANITVGDFCKLPYKDDFFDLVLDRASLCCLSKENLLKASSEVRRVLRPGGYFLSFMYPDNHFVLKDYIARKIEENTFIDFNGSTFKNCGLVHFVNEKEIKEDIYKGYEINYIEHSFCNRIYPNKCGRYNNFIILGKKK